MANHIKPTKEELEKGIQEATEKGAEPDVEVPEIEETPETPEEKDGEENVEEEVELENEEEVEEAQGEDEAEDEREDAPDYKEKFKQSSREAQKIHAKNRKLSQAIDEASEIPEPSDEEMAQEYQDWDAMSNFEQKLAKEAVVSKKWREKIANAQEETKKIEKWGEDVDNFIEDPQTLIDNPDLEGKQDEFRLFANQDTNNSVPFKILVAAFLHEQGKGKKPNKGKQMETPKGGGGQKPVRNTKLTLEQANQLMKTNYTKYKQYLRDGKIEMDVK